MLGEEYKDYDLVIAQINGRPYEQRIIDKMFYTPPPLTSSSDTTSTTIIVWKPR